MVEAIGQVEEDGSLRSAAEDLGRAQDHGAPVLTLAVADFLAVADQAIHGKG